MSGTIAEIEFVIRDVLDSIGQRPLIEIPLPFGWTAGRSDRRRLSRLADVDENTHNRRWVGDCGDQTHLCPAMGADQRQYIVDSSPQVLAPAKPAYITSL